MAQKELATVVVRISETAYRAVIRDAVYGESFDTVLRRRLKLDRPRRKVAKKNA